MSQSAEEEFRRGGGVPAVAGQEAGEGLPGDVRGARGPAEVVVLLPLAVCRDGQGVEEDHTKEQVCSFDINVYSLCILIMLWHFFLQR